MSRSPRDGSSDPLKGKPRDVAKRETRDALIAAGMAAFAEEGLDVPSLDSICARAGYTRGAFYVHFKDRDDFLTGVMGHIFEQFLDAIIATGDAALDLQKTIDAFVGALEARAFPLHGAIPMYQFMAACARSPRVRENYVAVLRGAAERVAVAAREGQQAGTVRSDIDPDNIATILVAIALGAQSMTEVDYPLEVAPAAREVATVLLPQRSDED